MKTLDRRTVLKGAGVALSLPFLNAMVPSVPATARAAEVLSPKRRMVAVRLGFGLLAKNLFPDDAGRNYTSTPYLDALQDFRNDFTIFSGTSHPDVDGGHAAGASYLTAARAPGSTSFKNSISIDQLAAEHLGRETRFSSLVVATTPGNSISVSRSGVKIPSESRPSRLFAQMFLESQGKEKQYQIQRLKDRQSVIDAVMGEAKRLQRRVGPEDRQTLDQYFTSVRETEERLVQAQDWETRPKPKVSVTPPKDNTNRADHIIHARLMYDMIHLALQTDSSRLITMDHSGVNTVLAITGVDQDYHMLSHHGNDTERLRQLGIIELEEIKAYAEFLEKLRSSPDGNGTLLDHTMVLFGSDMGNHNGHNNQNLPILLAGGGFQHGQHLAFDRDHNYPLANLYVSMLQRLGLELDHFASSSGTMNGLEMLRS